MLHLEFAPGARRRSLAGRALLFVAGALLMVVVVVAGSELAAQRRDLRSLAEIDSRLADAARPRGPAPKPDAASLARVKSTQQVAQRLTAPWSDLLDAIESAPQQSVALLAIEPSSAKPVFRLTAEARDAPAMLAYLAALQKDPRLSSTILVSHQVQVQAAGRPIRFQVQSGWGTER